jgi:hypothetical protein
MGVVLQDMTTLVTNDSFPFRHVVEVDNLKAIDDSFPFVKDIPIEVHSVVQWIRIVDIRMWVMVASTVVTSIMEVIIVIVAA